MNLVPKKAEARVMAARAPGVGRKVESPYAVSWSLSSRSRLGDLCCKDWPGGFHGSFPFFVFNITACFIWYVRNIRWVIAPAGRLIAASYKVLRGARRHLACRPVLMRLRAPTFRVR